MSTTKGGEIDVTYQVNVRHAQMLADTVIPTQLREVYRSYENRVQASELNARVQELPSKCITEHYDRTATFRFLMTYLQVTQCDEHRLQSEGFYIAAQAIETLVNSSQQPHDLMCCIEGVCVRIPMECRRY